VAHVIQKVYLKYHPEGWIPTNLVYRLYLFNCETHIKSKHVILQREYEAAIAHLLLFIEVRKWV